MGMIAQTADGTTIYHAGDTSITAEMAIYAQLYPLDVAILPIFGIGTMDGYQAAAAVRMMNPKHVMPVHFDFCEDYGQDPDRVLQDFYEQCRLKASDVKIIQPVPGRYVEI
jgi:L-ascorbate metabolism protein UlaG (beta-lactamase superfamily)